ncbi:MAG: SRPBCC domain-containing protein [Acidimicrobiaceae bacterium]|nr:SRPBCC domain-containing protein [Acidimicrobiaceae bacterium]
MTHTASVRVNVWVAVTPAAAFEIFTADIDHWYQRGPHAFADPARAVAVRFEPGVGGRLIEVHDAASGQGPTMGRVTVWEPGRRLVFVDTRDTEIDVTFDAEGEGTRVTLEHRGLEKLRPDLADMHGRFGGRLLLAWFTQYLQRPNYVQEGESLR